MYICPKCKGSAFKERIKIQTYTEDYLVKTGDAKCSKCGYTAPIKDFKKETK